MKMIRNSKSRLVGILYSSDPMTTRDRPQQSRGIAAQHEHNPRDCQATPTNSNLNTLVNNCEKCSTTKRQSWFLGSLNTADQSLIKLFLATWSQPHKRPLTLSLRKGLLAFRKFHTVWVIPVDLRPSKSMLFL